MRTFSRSVVHPVDKSYAWELLTDVKTYPEYLKFVKKVRVLAPLNKNGAWEDKHTVLFIPLTTRHKVTEYIFGKKITFCLNLPFSGTVIEKLEVEGIGKGSKITFTFEIFTPNRIYDFILGSILEKRLKILIEDLVLRIQAQKSKPF